ncbi:hypothetical protein BgiBS90_023498, partial [Biomphalaria glabrata]
MNMSCHLNYLILIFVFYLTQTFADFPYKKGFFDQYVDHFNLISFSNRTFKQYYLYQ